MPAAATITAARKAAMTIVRLEDPRGFASPRRVPVLSITGEVIVDFGDRRFFSEFCFKRATIFYPLRACDHYRLYIALAAASARAHPARFPRASSRLARAKVAANFAFARCSARLIELGVGWRSICAAIDWRAIGPAFGFPADCRTASSNCAISALQGPACADSMLRPKAKMKKAAAIRGLINVLLTFGCRVGVRSSSVPSSHRPRRPSRVLRVASLGIGPQIEYLFPIPGMQRYKAYAEFDAADRRLKARPLSIMRAASALTHQVRR